MTIPLIFLVLFLLYLVYERVVLNKLRRSIPLVIAVTGTRGKSSVVRMLASVLREDGRRVLAKTTGSQAQLVLPDGSIQDIPRRGVVSILEQKKILKKAADLNVDYVVVEIMSIRPENHLVEAQQILKPDIVVVTNVRRDHVEAMGETGPEIASVFTKALPRGSSVYVPEEYAPLFLSSQEGPIVVRVLPVAKENTRLGATEFAENMDLVTAVSKDLGVADEVLARGMENVPYDIGKLRIWKHKVSGKTVFLVNAFAANDPDSTMIIYDQVARALSAAPSSFSGLLNLRHDRADRTIQWIESLHEGAASRFKRIYAIDGHANVLRRNIHSVTVLPHSDAKKLTDAVTETMEEGGVLFGFGNIGGMGHALVDHWQHVGEEYGH
ncbi:MAG: poly-gamma-glutamate synthase PgsB [Ignavibacteriales bacterium]|nr:poly-gamma-glutamate synthase PgsB [Ignavibacteriales bacterium]